MNRTMYAGELSESHIGEKVNLCGWVQKIRNLGTLIFIDLRDREGILQLVIDEDSSPEVYEQAKHLGREFVIQVEGIVRERSNKNPSMKTGDVEVEVTLLKVLNKAKVPPIHIEEDDNASETLKLQYRYLDLRKKSAMDRLRLRSKLNALMRNYLLDEGFIEFETPILNKSTPEGARDYLIPSRVNPGKFYALPQSPQIFKQLLMISGADKYFQIARCFRDEDLRADRQPEFTQMDIEMSFVDQEDVLSLNEGLIQKVFKEMKGIDIPLPFPRMTYHEALERYGSDKPDTRFGMELLDVNEIFKDSDFGIFASAIERGESVGAIFAEGDNLFSKKGLKNLEKKVKTFGAKGLATLIFQGDTLEGSLAKVLSEKVVHQLKALCQGKDGILFFVADKKSSMQGILGNLRVHLGKELELYDPETVDILWIVDFPAFHYDEEEQRYVSEHHPFTNIKEEDRGYMDTDPLKILADCYDLVINGYEVASGSIRIHEGELQSKVFDLLGISEEEKERRFGFFIDALQYGTPPHGGIAYGMDRLIMILTGTEVIRDVVAFPKTLAATCLMSHAPSEVDDVQLEELHIQKRGEQC